MTMRQAFDDAMQRETPDEAMRALRDGGVWMADVDTMTQAIHQVYCGIMADHEQPNEKDRDQARQLIAAIGQSIGTGAAATKD
jgi:crotonobetainyl-CoA:carnitine CoA-transferase CaiB-like acyl-CoA transferase